MGNWSYFTATMASAGTLTSEFVLTNGYSAAYLEIPAMTSSSTHYLVAAATTGGTYRRVKQWNVASAAVSLDYQILSSTTNSVVPIPAGLKYVKLETQDTINNGAFYKIYCAD